MAHVKTNVMRILDKAKIDYEISEYHIEDGKIDGEAVAKKINKPAHQVFKTLVAIGHSKTHYVFVVPVEHEIDFKKASKVVGEKSMEMLQLNDLQKTTGYIRGGCSPIGMKKTFQTVIDAHAEQLEEITFSAGKIGYQVTLAPIVLSELIGASFADVIKDK